MDSSGALTTEKFFKRLLPATEALSSQDRTKLSIRKHAKKRTSRRQIQALGGLALEPNRELQFLFREGEHLFPGSVIVMGEMKEPSRVLLQQFDHRFRDYLGPSRSAKLITEGREDFLVFQRGKAILLPPVQPLHPKHERIFIPQRFLLTFPFRL